MGTKLQQHHYSRMSPILPTDQRYYTSVYALPLLRHRTMPAPTPGDTDTQVIISQTHINGFTVATQNALNVTFP